MMTISTQIAKRRDHSGGPAAPGTLPILLLNDPASELTPCFFARPQKDPYTSPAAAARTSNRNGG